MHVVVRMNDGTETSLANVRWHPERKTSLGDIPAGLWTTEDDVLAYWRKLHPDCIITRDNIREIDCAEAPVDIYTNTEDNMPWRHFGTLLKEVHAGNILSLSHTFENCA